MALNKRKKFDLERIYKLIKNKRYIKNCRISENELKEIFDDYYNSILNGHLETIKNEILDILNKNLPQNVHSIRGRVKDEDHLIEKIIRNSSENEEKYSLINIDNYNKIITDLIGIRVIILDKRDWEKVHTSILKVFRNNPKYYSKSPQALITDYDKYEKRANKVGEELKNSYHVEPPQVYITTEDDRELYNVPDLQVNRSRTNYRSIHYIIRYKDVYFEIQVRTLFEDGWLEFDHRIKYPYDQNNIKKNNYIRIFNALAQAADQLISFYDKEYFENADIGSASDYCESNNPEDDNRDDDSLDGMMNDLF